MQITGKTGLMSSSVIKWQLILNILPFGEASSHAVAKTFKEFNLQIHIAFHKKRNSCAAWISSKNGKTELEMTDWTWIWNVKSLVFSNIAWLG